MWRYLQNCFADADDILSLGNLPLLPLNISKIPVTLARLCEPSRVVLKHFYGHCLDDDVSDILVKLGVLIMTDYPSFIGHHPAVSRRFVHPPSVQGVLKAMVVSSSMMTNGKLFEIVRIVLSTKEKQLLRSFLVNIKCKQLYQEEYDVLCSLPVLETLAKKFVSAKEGLCAAPPEPLPITLRRDLVDVSQDDSMTFARLLGVKILTPVELLCQVVFPDIKRGCYSEEQIDKLMEHVLDRYASAFRKNAYFKRNLQDLAFVSRQKGRARPCELFDPRNVIIKNLFVHEDVFPSSTYGSPSVLVILEELGMKGEDDVTATDLYQSAKMISKFANLPSLKEKSKRILHFLKEDPQKMLDLVSGQQLWILLRTIPWVSRQEQRPYGYPPCLPYWKTEDEESKRFFKPAELKSHQFANLIGSVMPVVDVGRTETISQFFGWQDEPPVNLVVHHLETAVRCYSPEQKPYFIVMLTEIYRFLGEHHHNVDEAFDATNVFPWVWNGDGFSLPSHLLATRPSIDLAPYIRCLPLDFGQHCRLFGYFGMQKECDPSVLLRVLRMIKAKHDSGSVMSPSEVKHDLQLSVNILNELASGELSEALQGEILIPTYQEDNSCVRLQPVESCMYGEQSDDEEIDYFYVHPNVPNVTAERLGVPSITNRLLDADELAIGEEFGQGEKLTTRLNRLLEEYTDGFSVLKELIQNADDAGATEVKFLYDERTNEKAMTCLIDEGMRGCQGPALWVYNDATFKDEDFENITKLNEATKQHDTEKIGRFGLGFNAVYNLTDVPMFISRNSFVIFDPHTSYLGKALKNKTTPGMKINVNKDVTRLRKFKNQFKPFNGIFGCDLDLQKEDNSFNGTLFRFPLRTSEQALKSEIKKLAYDDSQMRELLLTLIKGAETLLLFTQNVLRVSIFSLNTPEVQDETVKLMFKVTKSLSQDGIVRALSVPVSLPPTANFLSSDDQNFLKQCSFLQASSRVLRAFRTGQAIELTKSSMKVNVHCVFTECGLRFFKPDVATIHPECTTWLIVSSMGDGLALKFAENDFSLLPSGGVAVQVAANSADKFVPVPVFKNDDGIDVNGTLFCYLPLPIHSGLPVHVNGAFALAANRRHLQEKLEGDKDCYGVDWNKALMVDSICSAYVCLLEDLKSIAPTDESYRFHSLWPKADEVLPNLRHLTQSFYRQISMGTHALFSDGENWFTVSEVVLLHPVLRNDPSIGDTSFKVFQLLMSKRAVVIDVPLSVVNSFQSCGSGEVFNSKIYDKNRFLRQVFFPNISAVPSDMRDKLVLHAMDNNCDDLVKTHSCIPASPLGNSLRRPSELIHPGKDAAPLFLPEDGRFPCGNAETFLNPGRLAKLELLGMASDYLPWQEMAERAESINKLNAVNSKAAEERAMEFVNSLEKKIRRKDETYSDLTRQNADDAQATEICFIKDPRHHPDEKVFGDCWKTLQGPALCVYNNKPFTNSDLQGIQNLGEGTKGEDPNKTGQYGVGFNAVYHLTDVPSFMSQGKEIGDVLCVFDPHCKYVPGATPLAPGGKFKDTATLSKKFPDVFPCYLLDHFKIDNATMFRFPLRTKDVARESEISSNSVSVKELDVMMEGLKEEMFEVLLFVNNVRKITVCEIDAASKNLVNSYTVEAEMSKKDEAKRKAFADHIKQISKLAKEREGIDPRKIPIKKVSYLLNIRDTSGNAEKWRIVQKVGFEKDVEESIIDAFKKQELGMLPRGGIACLLEKNHLRYSSPRQKKAYCFLPLPLETNLPVHVNGHFALDHESRRSLWRDDENCGGYRSDWNNLLLQDVVASCYITMLVEVRDFLKLSTTRDTKHETETEILSKINVYESFFPCQIPADKYWKTLVDSVYREMTRMKLKILPVVRKRSLDCSAKITAESPTAEITWLPPAGIGKHQAFFNDLEEKGPFAVSPHARKEEKQAKKRKLLRDILLGSGFNLVVFSLALHDSFQRAGVATRCISPREVIDFYKTFNWDDPLCTIGPIPCDVQETTLKSALGVTTVLLYCRLDDSFLSDLPGLPLLLTHDQRLQLFSSKHPKFLSKHRDLLPRSPQIFLHDLLYGCIFNGTDKVKLTSLKHLDAASFATNLPQTLPIDTYGSRRFTQWYPNQGEIPNRKWIFKTWIFLSELVEDVITSLKPNEERKIEEIQKLLAPLLNWSILPVTEKDITEKETPLVSFRHNRTPPPIKHYLLPLGLAASALDFGSADSSNSKLVDILRKIGLPELNLGVLLPTSLDLLFSSKSTILARMLVSSLKSPASLLTSLDHKMVSEPQSLDGRLNTSECITILEYFSKSLKCLGGNERETLRRLSVYPATHGGLIRLSDRRVCVLPTGIPRDEIDVIESELDIVFLESQKSISELFKFLALEFFSAVDIYCIFILPNFSILSKEGRESHLTYIRKNILENAEGEEKRKLLECLRNTPLVPSSDGSLKTASCFFDHENKVFSTMLPKRLFPMDPFDKPQWLTFLRQIGLTHIISKDCFITFATEVAQEASSAPSDNTRQKSQVLVEHLIN